MEPVVGAIITPLVFVPSLLASRFLSSGWRLACNLFITVFVIMPFALLQAAGTCIALDCEDDGFSRLTAFIATLILGVLGIALGSILGNIWRKYSHKK